MLWNSIILTIFGTPSLEGKNHVLQLIGTLITGNFKTYHAVIHALLFYMHAHSLIPK